MKNCPQFILCFFIFVSFQTLYSQGTCKDEESLMEDLNSIAKCTIEEVKTSKKSSHRRHKRINIRVSSKRIVKKMLKKQSNVLKLDAKINALKQQATLVSKLEIRNNEALINKLPFELVEEKPLFKACKTISKTEQSKCFKEQLKKHIARELNYPERALNYQIEGNILTQFIIDDKGNVRDIQVKKTQNSFILEKEAIRVIANLPKFVPGKVKGVPVYVNNGISISFTLPKEDRIPKKEYKPIGNILNLEEADEIPQFDKCVASKDTSINCFNKQMIQHVEENFKYPKVATEEHIEGKVLAKFVINKKGKVTNIQVYGPKHGRILEKATVRLLNKLDSFVPATKNNKPIDVQYSIPIDFNLS